MNTLPLYKQPHKVRADCLLRNRWSIQDRYMPRVGEMVLFTRTIKKFETISLDPFKQVLRFANRETGEWHGQPKWEAGVITQLPGDKEPARISDLSQEDEKLYNIAYSGFRVEPFPEPGNPDKPYSKQHKYIALSQLRPFVFWKECLKGIDEADWHPTINHARAVMASISLIGRFHFKGKWPAATIFCRAAYVGPELICRGDVVRLMPSPNGPQDAVADVLLVTSIKCKFVGLEEASEDDQDGGLPYKVCHHVSGPAFTMDPLKSYDSMGKVPVDPESGMLPKGLSEYGKWYHLTAPDGGFHWELPMVRVLDRCPEASVMKLWFHTPMIPLPGQGGFKAVNMDRYALGKPETPDISRGLAGTFEARRYSALHDPRIKVDEGKKYYWADNRIEQLDLDSVNDLGVGAKDELRTFKQADAWRKALSCLDGGKSSQLGYEQLLAERDGNKTRRAASENNNSGGRGIFASALRAREEAKGDAMNVDGEEERGNKRSHSAIEISSAGGKPSGETVDLSPDEEDEVSSEDDDDLAASQLVEELAGGGILDIKSGPTPAKRVKV